MAIKSLEDLVKIREDHKNKVNLRMQGEYTGDQIEVLVGMATCGISSGARETINTFFEEVRKENLEHVKVVPVGCIGYCHSEPIVQVNMPNQKPVLYGNVKKDKVHEIVQQHIKAGKPVENLVLQVDFERA